MYPINLRHQIERYFLFYHSPPYSGIEDAVDIFFFLIKIMIKINFFGFTTIHCYHIAMPFRAMIGCLIMGTPVSIYTQIGIILLVALSAKNGILIVEFARDFRAEGNSIREAAFEAGHVRLRPILMTSFAFVLGVMPLLFATGAGAQSRIALGAAVVFGMAMNTLLATIYIPNFYELMQKLQERFSKKKADDGGGKDAATQK